MTKMMQYQHRADTLSLNRPTPTESMQKALREPTSQDVMRLAYIPSRVLELILVFNTLTSISLTSSWK